MEKCVSFFLGLETWHLGLENFYLDVRMASNSEEHVVFLFQLLVFRIFVLT